MPDETQGVETTTASETNAAPAETGADGQPFDAARAQRTIETLRAENKNLKALSKQLEDAQARLQEIEDRDKTEVEKAAGRATTAEQKLSETEARLRAMTIRVAVAETASAAGIGPENVKAAIRLLDTDSLELDDDGQPKGMEAALKALVKEFPMLASESPDRVRTVPGDGARTATRSVPSTPRPNAQPQTREDRVKQAHDELAGTGAYRPL